MQHAAAQHTYVSAMHAGPHLCVLGMCIRGCKEGHVVRSKPLVPILHLPVPLSGAYDLAGHLLLACRGQSYVSSLFGLCYFLGTGLAPTAMQFGRLELVTLPALLEVLTGERQQHSSGCDHRVDPSTWV